MEILSKQINEETMIEELIAWRCEVTSSILGTGDWGSRSAWARQEGGTETFLRECSTLPIPFKGKGREGIMDDWLVPFERGVYLH